MSKKPTTQAAARALTQDELDAIAGGQQISSHEFPGGTGSSPPVFGPPVSIAAGEINENQTDNNLPA